MIIIKQNIDRPWYPISDYLSKRTIDRYDFSEDYRISHSLNSNDTQSMCIEDNNGLETGYWLTERAVRFDYRGNARRIFCTLS